MGDSSRHQHRGGSALGGDGDAACNAAAGRAAPSARCTRSSHCCGGGGGASSSRHYGTSKSRSPSPLVGNGGSIQQLVLSSTSAASGIILAAPGYEQYQKSLLEVPLHHAEYGEASSDDLSSEWDSDVPEPPRNKVGSVHVRLVGCPCPLQTRSPAKLAAPVWWW